MKAGEPADDADTWLRAVTNYSHVRQGRIHHAEAKKWLSPPDDPQAKWKLEISGELLSLVDDIVGRARERVAAQQEKLKAAGKPVPSVLQFCGILHAKAKVIRSVTGLKCDVIYDPQPNSDAHANLVVLDKGPDDILTVVATLLDTLVWVPQDQVSADQTLFPT